MEPELDIDLLELERARAKARAASTQGPAIGVDRAANRPMGKAMSTLTAAVSGIPGMEAIGGAISAMTGGTYQGGRRSIGQMQQRAKESIGTIPYEVTRMAPEVGAMVVAPVASAPRLFGTMGGRAGIAAGVEGVRGISRAGLMQEQAPSIGQTARAGATGAALGAAGSVGGELAMRGALGLGRGVRNVMQETGTQIPGARIIPRAQQAVSDVLRRTGSAIGDKAPHFSLNIPGVGETGFALGLPFTRAAELIEPIAETRVGRVMQEVLPPRQSRTAIAEAARESRETARQAIRTQQMSVREQARAGTEVARQRIAGIGEEALTRQQAIQATRRAQEEAAADILAQARQRAQQSVQEATERLRAQVPREVPTNADALREAIRRTQRKAGDASYARAFELAEGVDFSPVARQVESIVRRNPEVATAYRDAFTRGGATEAGEDVLPALDLPTFDRMRQNVNERVQAFLRGDATGIPRTKAQEALRDIGAMEDAYIGRIRETRGDEAASALLGSRAEYAEYFRQLDALADGRNLGRFGFGKKEGAIQPSRLNIARLERQLAEVSPEAQEAFRTGAREYVNDVIRRTPDDARRLAANLVGTEERFTRTALALGEDAANDLRVLYQDNQQVRQAARDGLLAAREQIRGVRQAARSEAQTQANLAAVEAKRAQQQIVQNRSQFRERLAASLDVSAVQASRVATEQARVAKQAWNAVSSTGSGADAAMAFAPTIARLSPESRATAAGVMANRIDNELMGLIGRPNGTELVTNRLRQLRENPAANQLLGTALEEAERRLLYGAPLRRPVGAVLGSSLASQFNSNR